MALLIPLSLRLDKIQTIYFDILCHGMKTVRGSFAVQTLKIAIRFSESMLLFAHAKLHNSLKSFWVFNFSATGLFLLSVTAMMTTVSTHTIRNSQ